MESLPTLGHLVWGQLAVDCVLAPMFHWFLSAICGTDRPYWLVLKQRTCHPLAWHCTSILLPVWYTAFWRRSFLQFCEISQRCCYQRGHMHCGIKVRLSTHLGRLWAGCSERQCSVIICQNLCWRTPLIEEHLQLVDYTHHILSRKVSSDGKLSGAAVDHRKKKLPGAMFV